MNEVFKNEIIKRIQAIVVPEDLANIRIGAIPLGKGIFLSKITGGQRTTESGIILPEMKSTWQQIGRIVALGPDCSENLKLGLLVTYNAMADIETLIHGKSYIITNEVCIESVIEDVENVQVLPKMPSNESPKALDRSRRIDEFNKGNAKIKQQGQNKLDTLNEKSKSKYKNR